MAYNISGIQQIGIGVPNVHEAWAWHRKHFGIDIPVFEEAAEANLMLPYTGGEPHKRHAILAVSANGGGGMEIWQYTSRTPQGASFTPQLGDLGIFAAKIKTRNVEDSYEFLKANKVTILSDVQLTPDNQLTFFVKDLYGNLFQLVQSNNWFSKNKMLTGAIYGCTIGVSDMAVSLNFYKNILGYDKIVFDETAVFKDFKNIAGAANEIRRVLLTHSKDRTGPFSKMLGHSQIELIENRTAGFTARQIFENRFWGDLGFIHLCFDISDMKDLRDTCAQHGTPFTVDSAMAHKDGFDMGEAAGHFSYIEDPDGTLIEFVETHKVPILKQFNWYIHLKDRNPHKALPNIILKMLRLNRKK